MKCVCFGAVAAVENEENDSEIDDGGKRPMMMRR